MYNDKILTCKCGYKITFIDGGFYTSIKSHWIGVIEKPYTLKVNGKSIIYNKLACEKRGTFIDEIGE